MSEMSDDEFREILARVVEKNQGILDRLAEHDGPVEKIRDFPFTKPQGSDADMFIQWKGTEVCLDFHCPCGAHGHLDDSFAYFVQCPKCNTVYQMGTQVIAKKVHNEEDVSHAVKMLEVEDDR